MADPPIRGIVLDIEGTTTPIEFVYKVLFPYAREHLLPFLRANLGNPGTDEIVALLEEEHGLERASDAPPLSKKSREARACSLAAYAAWLMDRDRKSTGLKALQGEVWADGYRNGGLLGEVFPDVPPALDKWRRAELDLRIFSSGSVLAQKLLFQHTAFGDLTGYLCGYFDTRVGPKTEASSYTRIVGAMALEAAVVLFVSDSVVELNAARQAGLRTALSVRPGNPQASAGHSHCILSSFAEMPL